MKDEFKDLIIVEPTDKKYTFLLDFDWKKFYPLRSDFTHGAALNVYFELSEIFVQEMRDLGLSTARLSTNNRYNSFYYITFRSIHDVMAFKLTYS